MNKKIFVKEVKNLSHKNTDSKKRSRKTDWFFSRASKIKIFILILLIFILTTATSVWVNWKLPIISPINSLTTFSFLSEYNSIKNNEKVIYGFLPYWNTQKVALQDELTHLGYFSLTLDAQGNFIESYDNGELDMGLRRLNSETFLDLGNNLIENDKHVEIVITQFNHGDIVALLNSKKAQKNFYSSLDSVLLAYPINGVNIDIETSGETNEELRNNMTSFVKDLREHLNSKYTNMQLSIDMYAGAAQNKQIWDVEKIAPHVDYIIVMAYDFHRSSSEKAGPVAPLFGDTKAWEESISTYIQSFLDQAPREKILLGVPFYGYEWQTTSRESKAHTFPKTGATASYSRVLELLEKKEELQVQEQWNDVALSPYISYIEDDKIYVVYYENSRSLSYKLDYVNQLDLGGVAIWALGYEGDSRELWDVLNLKINSQN
jgi:spore germination protein YaaH